MKLYKIQRYIIVLRNFRLTEKYLIEDYMSFICHFAGGDRGVN